VFKSNKICQTAKLQNKHVIFRNFGSYAEYIKTEVILIISSAAKTVPFHTTNKLLIY